MDAKLFKAVWVFRNVAPNKIQPKHLDNLSNYEIDGPGSTQWRTMGFAQVEGDAFWISHAAGRMMLGQLRERVLPSATVKDAMAKRLAKIEDDTGRRPHKKEFAVIKDEVISELLPRAFIRSKSVPMLLRGDYLFVFTSSSKLADDLVTMFFSAIGNDKVVQLHRLDGTVEKTGSQMMTALAADDRAFSEDKTFLTASTSATLKGPEKKTVRVKDLDVLSGHVQQLLEDDYNVTQMGLNLHDTTIGSDPIASFTLNESLLISRLVLSGIASADAKADKADKDDALVSHVWLVCQALDDILGLLEDALGLKTREDDDEL